MRDMMGLIVLAALCAIACVLLPGCQDVTSPLELDLEDGAGGLVPGPRNLQAQVLSSSEILLNWEDISQGELGYEIHESSGWNGSFYPLDAVPSEVTSYKVVNRSHPSVYRYKVRAVFGSCSSDFSNVATAVRVNLVRTMNFSGTPNSFAFSPDEEFFCVADGTVKLIDPADGRITSELEDMGEWWISVAASPDGGYLAVGSVSGAIALWEVETGRMVDWIVREGGEFRCVVALNFSPDASRLAVGYETGAVEVIQIETRLSRLLCGSRGFDPYLDLVYRLSFSPDGQLLAVSWWNDDNVMVFNVESSEMVIDLRGTWGCFAFDPSGQAMAVYTRRGSIVVLDVVSGETIEELGYIGDVCFNPDGSWLAIGWEVINLIDTASWQLVTSVDLPVGEVEGFNQGVVELMELIYSPSWKYIVGLFPDDGFSPFRPFCSYTVAFWI